MEFPVQHGYVFFVMALAEQIGLPVPAPARGRSWQSLHLSACAAVADRVITTAAAVPDVGNFVLFDVDKLRVTSTTKGVTPGDSPFKRLHSCVGPRCPS
jgi:hypothetical protein